MPSENNTRGDLGAYRSEFVEQYKIKNPRLLDSKTRNNIFHYMKGKKITFEIARQELLNSKERRIYKRTAYSAKLKVKMAKGIQVFSANDREEMRVYMGNFIFNKMNVLGKANFKKVKF